MHLFKSRDILMGWGSVQQILNVTIGIHYCFPIQAPMNTIIMTSAIIKWIFYSFRTLVSSTFTYT